MKISFHIQPSQFEYIGFEYEQTEGLSNEAIKLAISDYRRSKEALNPASEVVTALSPKDWNTALDSYINGNPMDSNTYYAMSPDQQKVIQELKKCFKRIKSRNGEDEIE